MKKEKSKADLLKEYNEMADGIENAPIYDGRGTYDLYECPKCGAEKITTYSVKGVTPFCIICSCGGVMQHTRSYKRVPESLRVDEWIRPSFDQMMLLSDGLIEHVLQGGLILRKDLKE